MHHELREIVATMVLNGILERDVVTARELIYLRPRTQGSMSGYFVVCPFSVIGHDISL